MEFIDAKKFVDGCIYVDTKYKTPRGIETEEEYVDVGSQLDMYGYDADRIISSIDDIKIGKVRKDTLELDGQVWENSAREAQLIGEEIAVSDNFELFDTVGFAGDTWITAISVEKPQYMAIISLESYAVISSNMSIFMLIRATLTVLKHKDLLLNGIQVREETSRCQSIQKI